MSKITQGRRISGDSFYPLEPGDYGLNSLDKNFLWFRTPNGIYGRLNPSVHQISENADGTISVSPSILCNERSLDGSTWHGYLENGVWREC